MDPTLIVLGIQATLRVVKTGADLYGEHVRDRSVFLPYLKLPEGSKTVQVQQFLNEDPQLAASTPELADIWDATNKELITTDPPRIDTAYTIILQSQARSHLTASGKSEHDAQREAQMGVAGHMVAQWRLERTPPSAMVRMALTLTDIGLEFVASEPSILGIGGRGERLIVAFARNMSVLIPDDVAAFGPKTDFADRVLGIFLKAGLGTLAGNASIVVKDEDVAKLLAGVTKPIVDALPQSITEQIHYRDLVDALAGPSAEAAFKLLAENTGTYLGQDFADDKALGAVTSAFFEEIKDTAHGGSIVDVFSEQGAIRLYQAGLGVAVERPGLFVGDDTSAKSQMFRELLSGTSKTLQMYPRFKGPVGASLAAMVVETVGHNAPALLQLKPDEPWEKVAAKALEQVTSGLADALKNQDAKGALKSFSDGQLLELGRVVLAQVAQTPGMLGIERSEVQSIVAGMAAAMAADDKLLLSADGWLRITGVAVRQAASNPGRLFCLSADDQKEGLAVMVMTSVLKVAGETWTLTGRSAPARPLLFGDTLEAALTAAIEALAGNVAAVVGQPDLVDQFLRVLMAKAAANPEKFGSAGLLNVFRAGIGKVMAEGTLPTDTEIDDTLTSQEA